MKNDNSKAKLLLDVCCGVCFAGVFEQLSGIYDIVVYWHNANIYPENEYLLRLNSHKNAFLDVETIVDNNNWDKNHKAWLDYVESSILAEEPEGGKRCIKCYQYRLNRVAKYAQKDNFDFFASTLTISPHKNADIINKIGLKIESDILHNVQDDKPKFFSANFKKNDGFKIANLKANNLGLYRQKYCGCEFSIPC